MSETWDEVEQRRVRAVQLRDGALDVDALRALLADEEWRVRKQAAETASLRLDEPALRRALADALLQPDDVGLRNAAIEAFVRAPRPQRELVSETLVDALGRSTATARKFVCAALVGGGAAGLDALASLAADPDVMTSAAAIEAVAAIGRANENARDRARDILVVALARTEAVLRLAALEGLRQSEAEAPAAPLLTLVGDPVLGASAVSLLGRAHGDDVPMRLVACLAETRTVVEAALALAERSLTSTERASAREALAVLSEPSRRRLLHAMREREPDEARAIARWLLEAGHLDALGAIVELGARIELDPGARAALVALGARAVGPLLTLGRERAEDAVREAAWALEATSDLAALLPMRPSERDLGRDVAALARTLLVQGEEVAARAGAVALGRWGDVEDIAVLDRMVGTYSPSFDAAARDAIAALLERTSPSERDEVVARTRHTPAHGITWDGGAIGTEARRAALSSHDAAMRAGALESLRDVSDAERVELASMALTDEDERVQVAALEALCRVRGQAEREDATRAVRLQLRADQESVRAAAARALADLGAIELESVRDDVVGLLEDRSPRVVIAALRALAVLGPTNVVDEALDRALAHDDPEVVKEALRNLERRDDAAAVSKLAAGLEHAHWSVRLRAAELLGGLANHVEAARVALTGHESDESDDLVRAAVRVSLAPPKTGGSSAR